MAVDTKALSNALSQYGSVQFCNDHENIYYLVVVDDWVQDLHTFNTIADYYILNTYPIRTSLTFVEGTIKAQYNL